ncbi:MAG: YifB family Mg chelatase-like AAA ATPase [Desulfobacterales bacterium]|nr:YifB family Mg chelatase-like AAA ATPase [Desulfobacterales bacterium]
MLSKMYSCAVQGLSAIVLDVEVDISLGLPVFNVVGLPETAVRESRERVRSAIQNAGYTFPMDRVVVNLAPADIKKEGTGLDLPVALGILCASGLFPQERAGRWLTAGELSLDGHLKPVKAALPFALAARDAGFKGIIIPKENGPEAAMVKDIEVIAVDYLSQVVEFFSGGLELSPFSPGDVTAEDKESDVYRLDFSQVRGQAHVKRALEIAAAGNHHVLLSGPPGSGKSMMAKRLPGILPLPSFEESMDIARVYSLTGMTTDGGYTLGTRPFRSPHHSISDAGLVGGGPRPMPGEISLAHHGVLFLDEVPEFRRNVLEVLRQPLEEGRISLARAGAKATYPCRFMLVAAMNPCPCGNLGNPARACDCTLARIRQYRSKISGPLMDRMDIQVEVPQVEYEELVSSGEAESSAAIRERVISTRKIQAERYNGTDFLTNGDISPDLVRKHCVLNKDAASTLERAMKTLNLSARAYTSILKVSRTIADLEGDEELSKPHILEAVNYKALDRPVDAM